MRYLRLNTSSRRSAAAGLASCAIAALAATGALAQNVPGVNETVVVTGSLAESMGQIDTAPASLIATSYSMSPTDIKGLVTATAVDLIRTIPGVYGGYVNGGIANGLGLRGWSGSGDGNSVAAYIDNYQRNVLSGGNSNGYLELHPLIPETIGSLDLVKGPFSVRFGGPFSFGGSLIINTADYVPTGVSQSVGSFGRSRTLLSYGLDDGDIRFYSVLEGFHEDGYRQNAEVGRINWFSKLTLPVGDGALSTTFQVFQNNFGQPMYPPLTDVLKGPKTQAVNPLDYGSKTQFTGTTNYKLAWEGFDITVNGFADKSRIYRSASRKSNSNPAASDPGLQNITIDDRWVYGGGLDVFRLFDLGGDASAGIRFGAQIQQNDAVQSRYPGFRNQPVAQPTLLNAAVQQVVYWGNFTELASSTYLDAQVKPLSWLKLSAGIRYDYFDYDVKTLSPAGAALPVYNAAGLIVTPGRPGTIQSLAYTNGTGRATGRGGIAILPTDTVTFYANIGEGVNPPHALVDLRTNRNLNTIGMISEEVGFSYDDPDLGLHFGADGYYTINSGEIISVGGVSTNVGKSQRRGGDVDGSIVAYRDNGYTLKINANASAVKARTVATTTPYITGVPPWQYAYGLDFDAPVNFANFADEAVRISLFHAFIGPTKNNVSGTVEAPDYDRITAKIAYRAPSWNNLEVYLGGIFYPHSVTSECCAYLTYDNSRAVAIVPRVQLEAGVAIRF